jgi:hypothetical protein
MKPLLTVFLFIFLSFRVLAQQEELIYYVILQELKVRDKPDEKAPVTDKLFLGDSVTVEIYSELKTKGLVDGKLLETEWAKIQYRGKTGWVFGGGLCALGITTHTAFLKKKADYEPKEFEKIDKLVKDSVLRFMGTSVIVKSVNGSKVKVTQAMCYGTDFDARPGADGPILERIHLDPKHPEMIEFNFNFTAIEKTLYVNLKTGKKFMFSVDCMESAVSPSGKYVIGIDMSSNTLLLAEFYPKKAIGKLAYSGTEFCNTELNWLSEKEVELTEINYETQKVVNRKIILIPQMRWKK